jgi:hypothetical protein
MIILLGLVLIIAIDRFLLSEQDHHLTDLGVQEESLLMITSSARLRDLEDMTLPCSTHFKVTED